MDVTLVTFNLRYATPEDGENAWDLRRPRAVATLRRLDADVVGLQEVLPEQRLDLEQDFPDYLFLGCGRDPDGSGEGVPLMLRRTLAPQQHGGFWLSDQPDQPGSRGWDACFPRHCTWVRLAHGLTVCNTHLDHVGARSRVQAAELILQRLPPPLVLCGDLNEPEDGPALQRLSQTLVDAWRRMHPSERPLPTWHDYGRAVLERAEDGRLDYVFVSRDVEVLEAETVPSRPDGGWPSDHHPVRVRLHLA